MKTTKGGTNIIIFEKDEFLDKNLGKNFVYDNKWHFVFIPQKYKNDFLLASEIRSIIENSLTITGEIYYYE